MSTSTRDDVRVVPDLSELTGDWTLDPAHTRLGFVARHAMVTKVRGSFQEFEGKAHLDGKDPSKSSAEVVIKVASITTGNEQRDGHLRTNDFFDAENYPEIRFTSTGVKQKSSTTYDLTGDLTIKDITRPVTIEFELVGLSQDPFGNTRAGFEGSTVVSRKDWGLTYNAVLETGGVLVSDKITIELDVSAFKAA
jgi:polyisoprenoid-binding protein YceI